VRRSKRGVELGSWQTRVELGVEQERKEGGRKVGSVAGIPLGGLRTSEAIQKKKAVISGDVGTRVLKKGEG